MPALKGNSPNRKRKRPYQLARPLSDRFQNAIDRAAMRAGKTGSDAYLEEWRSGDWQKQAGAPDALLDVLVADLEASYPVRRLQQLIQQGGWEADGAAS